MNRFKQEFIYETPKNLVHKSAIKEGNSNNAKRKLVLKKPDSNASKNAKIEVTDNVSTGDGDEHYIEEDIDYDEMLDDEQHSKVEVVYVSNDEQFTVVNDEPATSSNTTQASKEDKFIAMVYPAFKGKTKLEMIDEINDLKRQNELLIIKNKTYEATINSLLT